ncbi:MAG: Hsp20/alpha crystallin family protein [Fibrobacterales bacterium]
MSYYVSTPAKSLFDNFFNTTVETRNSITPKVDVYSDDKAYHLEIELPGFAKDTIAVAVKDGTLTISTTNEKSEEKKERDYHIRERSYRNFERSFRLGDTLDAESINAKHENGILTVTVNKKEKALPKQIAVD